MIKAFADRHTRTLWETGRSRRLPPGIWRTALRKLLLLDAAVVLEDLRSPPGNRLEALHGGRRGQHSIRVNDQYRVCFLWREGNAYEVELTDYH